MKRIDRSYNQMVLRVENEKLLQASKWRTVEEVPDFPFGSFLLLRDAIGAGRCYLSIDRVLAFRDAELVQTPLDRAFNLFLSNVLVLACIASVVMAFVRRDYWLLLGVPVALAAPITTRSAKRVGSLLLSTILWLALFFVLLFNDRDSAAWLVGIYLASSRSLDWLHGRSAIAVTRAAAESEPFFLYLLSSGDLALRDKTTGNFLFGPIRTYPR